MKIAQNGNFWGVFKTAAGEQNRMELFAEMNNPNTRVFLDKMEALAADDTVPDRLRALQDEIRELTEDTVRDL